MAGRGLIAAPAARARTNKGKIVKIAVVSVLALLLLMAVVVSMARCIGRESFLKVCVATHLLTICLRDLPQGLWAPAAGARMNEGKIVKTAVVFVLAVLLLTAAAGWLECYIGRVSFVKVCVATHVTNICLLARVAATARMPAARRFYGRAIIRSCFHLALNLYLVLVACREEVEDAA